MPSVRSRPKCLPLTINLPPRLRAGLQAIAGREVGALSYIIRRACLAAVERHKREKARDDAR